MPATARAGVVPRRIVLTSGALAPLVPRAALAQPAISSDVSCGARFGLYVDRAVSLLGDPTVYVALADAEGKILVEVGAAGAPDTWHRLDPHNASATCVPPSSAALFVVRLRTGSGAIYAATCDVPKAPAQARDRVLAMFLVEPVVQLRARGQNMVVLSRELSKLQGRYEDPRLLGINVELVARVPAVSR